ncbi:MAG: type I DNA topoisomerase [Candidatus Endonucleobacter bathymodioli]|uniref:DNA topoisomerase 1 n=1 Tax=Candidatus Endonucleibacter bathymodioli TaxID=539814 RepID=A0AA90NUX3_9GAMM|nr:type I DNA topoisomerase [Candidatus Endonucleobacter bathymodioli]
MGKSLVIVESPAKAKTINKYLGSNFVVKSSVGHIRDLPTSGRAKKVSDPKARAKAAAETRKLSPSMRAERKKEKAKEQLVDRMGIDPENSWAANYEILPGKEKIVEELRRLAASADTIYLATDLDREGEAIAWHLKEAIGGDDERFRRVVFNEITKNAIQSAFESPGRLNQDRVNAQQARRFLDRIVGYMVSPVLWAKIARGLSAGRVQSVAVRLVVEREREIRRFVPEEFWEVYVDLLTDASAAIRFQVTKENNEAFRPTSGDKIDVVLDVLTKADYRLLKREDKLVKSKPSAPFITSTLQQTASTRLGFSAKKVMMMAQRLYESGYITYMRTDSTNISSEALESVRGYIVDNFGQAYLPDEANHYSSKKGAQEAHEAIRPSNVSAKPEDVSEVERDAQRLYDLIWRQFVACQMMPAEYLRVSLTVNVDSFILKARGRTLKFDGFTRVQSSLAKKGEDIILPVLSEGDKLSLAQLDPKQLFTRPTARFSEASLIKELEKCGIGRPSTYVPIISTIQDRGYVSVKSRRFYAEKIGDIVTDRLVESFSDLLDFNFTAKMEENLDAVAEGNAAWKAVLDDFYDDFSEKLESALDEEKGMRANEPTPTSIKCPTCGMDMVIRTASTGVFLGCSGYALPPKERCKTTVNLVAGDDVESDDEYAEVNELRAMRRCPMCSTAMENYLIDEGRKLHVCGNNPDCSGYEVESGSFKLRGYDGPILECDKCSAEMQLKTGRFGKYFGCTNEECKNTRKLMKSGEAAPPKMDPVPMPDLECRKVEDHYILRDGASGLFLAASKFPKNRETRAPLVAELFPYKSEIDQKYNYLFNAPLQDPDDNPSIIRYSRKTKEQYVMSEVDGKATGWSATYKDGRWVEKNKSEKAKK